MPRSLAVPALVAAGASLLTTGSALAQSTMPHWSVLTGGTSRDEITAICRGPGSLLTVAGWTQSANLPASGLFGAAFGGGPSDAFVAQFDPATGTQLWCAYLGGAGTDMAFDLAVDPASGVLTVVGLTTSANFPAPLGQPSPTLQGPSDGFVAQIDASGAVLLASVLVGTSADDRLTDLEPDGSGGFRVAGVAEGPGLPAATNPFQSGYTDAFVSRLDSSLAVQWSRYFGGSSTEGIPFATWAAQGFGTMWPGNLDRMDLAVESTGHAVLLTASFAPAGGTPAPTTPGAYMPAPAAPNGGDAYLAIVDPPGTGLTYATFFGGTGDERPRALAAHPGGGYVLGGTTSSANLPVTAGCLQSLFQGGASPPVFDGFLAWIDPAQPGAAALRYGTYVGGNAGEDNILALAVESSGTVTAAGYTMGGTTVIAGATTTLATPRSAQTVSGANQLHGLVLRLRPGTSPTADLLYASLLGGAAAGSISLVNGFLLDAVGDVHLAGGTTSPTFPTSPPSAGPAARDAFLMHLPLLPGGVFRDGLAFATPACADPVYTGTGGAPVPGTTFQITATQAPPLSLAVLLLGTSLPAVQVPAPWNGWAMVNALVLHAQGTTSLGGASFALPVPAAAPVMMNYGLAAQWFVFTNPACPGTGMLGNSERLNF